MSAFFTARSIVIGALLVFLALLPVYVVATGQFFPLTLFTRIVILALAATSLNLILGYGGMVSFGHAAYLGLGGYVVGILAKEGITSGFVQWPLAIAASVLFGLVVGALCLRARGVYFIMITLAFAQMIYYVAVGLDRYGGRRRAHDLSAQPVCRPHRPLRQGAVLLSVPCLAHCGDLHRLPPRRFALRNGDPGLAIERPPHARDRISDLPLSARRLRHRRHDVRPCGALLANHTDFISPAVMHWTRSGDLIVMIVLGGMGSLFGPLIGAVTLLMLEEGLSRVTEYWQIIVGPLLLFIVVYARGGIAGALAGLHRG